MAAIKRFCQWCNSHYTALTSKSRFCSTSCRCHAHRNKHSADKQASQAQQTVVEYMSNAISQLSQTEIIGALGVLWTETPEEMKERKESLLYTLLKKKQQQ